MPDLPEIVIDETNGPLLYLRKVNGDLVKIDLDPSSGDVRFGGKKMETVPTEQEVFSAERVSTTRTDYGDVPLMTLTVAKAGKYRVEFDAMASNSSTKGYVYCTLNFDGSDIPSSEKWFMGKYDGMLRCAATIQAASGEVIKVRYKRVTAGSAYLSNKNLKITRLGD